ncbi:uncharacterized protein LOC108865159 [Galendromus occidentalis]|uniref:Uncharacterized protein LOC108865159 n=1 Tax=Galendromus occidentalis TaxID=34638 RepID=A0AAJ7L8L0_9ACAR|nr:uncharacterized protein LOC108865159 [Galendromus occidentalis]
MGLNSLGSGVAGSAEGSSATASSPTPMRKKKNRKSAKDDKISMATQGPTRDQDTPKQHNSDRLQGLPGSGKNGGASKSKDSGRPQTRKKTKAPPNWRCEKRDDDDGCTATEDLNPHTSAQEYSLSEANASRDSDASTVELSMSHEAALGNRIPGLAPSPGIERGSPSTQPNSLYNSAHPLYLRPDYLDLLNEHARHCP